eukprot:CAMPEP_0172468514 /NCGR_PEP_ID=MMETSP1065-20121228/61434_1 /TAXON_ID=265537 /ORGANISM="Amphiprora paludosa, Strain CCMP125" /LENGTH=133 /DNA_ID=CAMNT_0013225911 /DNA_START=138 /DNA_END=539 /DNA_ORIENTATION=-
MVSFGSRKVKEESWEDFHRNYHSDSFKFSSNNERMLQSVLFGSSPTHSQRSLSSQQSASSMSSSSTSWFGTLFQNSDQEEDYSVGSQDSRNSSARSFRRSRSGNSSMSSSRKGSPRVKKSKSSKKSLSSGIWA